MKKKYMLLMSLCLSLTMTYTVYGMHIAEGFLPPMWSAFYFVLSAPFLYLGFRDIRKKTSKNKDLKMLLALVGAYSFVLSAMKIPSVTGSCSHPTGTGFGAMIFGPFAMGIISVLVLLFQALFLAHGGITTLGANVFSMGIVGPMVSFILYSIFKKKNKSFAIFIAAMMGDLATYFTTSVQLAFAFPSSSGGVLMSFTKFVSIFAVTQIPLAIVEGIVTVIIFSFIEKYSSKELKELEEVK